jgi:hypothetical protein
MSSIPIYDGKLWSPHFVFLADTTLSDRALLGLFRLDNYVPTATADLGVDYLGISRDEAWTHIVDNFGYTHWHSKVFSRHFASLSGRMDVFYFMMGDSDMSFELSLYRRGSLVRHVRWDDPHYTGGHLVADFGTPLEFEESISRGHDPYDGLLQVAAGLGIQTDYSAHQFRLYAPLG